MTTAFPLDNYHPSQMHAALANSPQQETVNPDGLSKTEITAVAESVLSGNELALWHILHDPQQVDGRSRLTALCQRAGFTDIGPNASKIVSGIFGKMDRAGIPRARSLDIMCGFTAERIKAGLTALFDAEDDRIKVKALDVASKVAGLQSGNQTTVNLQVNLQVKAQVAMVLDDAETTIPD